MAPNYDLLGEIVDVWLMQVSVIANYELSHGQWTGLVEFITEPCLNSDPAVREVGNICGRPYLGVVVEVTVFSPIAWNVGCELNHG